MPPGVASVSVARFPRPVRWRSMTDRILILDFGSQVTQLIARRVRESGVYCEIFPYNVDVDRIRAFDPAAVILSGGPASVYGEGAPLAPPMVFEMGKPVLGICYGEQLMCHQLGGRVDPSDDQEFGRAELNITDDCRLFDGVFVPGSREQVWICLLYTSPSPRDS